MNLKWSESVMFKFLELYHKHDCLWNHRLYNYNRKDARDNALGSIVKEMEIPGLTIVDLKNKIKTIRTMYKKEHSLVCKSKKNGDGTEEVYVPKLVWYKRADLFLNDVTNTRDTSLNLNLQQHDESESETIQNETENPDGSEFPASITAVATGNVDIQEEMICVENTETANPSTPKQSKMTKAFRHQNRKRKISENVTDNISFISAAIDKLDKVVQNNENENEFDIFARHVAVQLKQMPLYDAIICQEQIQTVIIQKRLELLSKVRPRHTTPSPELSNVMEEELWSSPVLNVPCKKEDCREDSHD